MLQIVTGKFFKREERYKTPRKAVLFSNYAWIKPIQTCIGTLEPVDSGSITTWIFSYVNQMEKEEGNFSIVSVGDEEIVEQFRLLAVFGLRAYFAPQRHEVEHYCRRTPTSLTDDIIPSQMLQRYFAFGLPGKSEDPEDFAKLVEKTLSLRRERYLATMAAMRAFCSALEAITTSVDLAYSMLIYALESLAQGFDDYEPAWEDYEDKVRNSVDCFLASVPAEVSSGIRAALLGSAHLKLMKRFLRFIEAHTDNSYFTRGAEGVQAAIRKAEFPRALRNAYEIRSGYVHELKPIISQLRVPTISQQDAFRWGFEPYLTFSGLVRLTAHVLRNFIERGESLANENVNWRDQLPGRITMRLAPEYWIHQAASFSPQSANERYTAFLEHFVAKLRTKEPIVELTSVMEKIEQSVDGANERQKTAMLCLYWVYNCRLVKELRRPNWEPFLKRYETLLDKCGIETASARLALGGDLEWNFQECSQCYEEYDRARFGNSVIHIPHALEIGMMAAVANKALAEGRNDAYESYLQRAILNCPGLLDVQTVLRDALEKGLAVRCGELLFGKPKPRTEQAQKTSKSESV
jgi:hypothetical protein